mgnify:CR=1 FL=1
MTAVFFYHLERQPLEQVLPKMLVTSLERGWRVVVQAGSDERAEALSSLLWTFDDEVFVPHGTRTDGLAELQPIWLTSLDENPNVANVRFYVDGAPVGAVDGLTRAVILFDGADEESLQRARAEWKRLRAEGHEISYWQQDEHGRWQNRAAGAS